jgi:gamma-glutamylcysteine synthetase
MEAYFDAAGPHGRTMMCSTAALQVNLGLGPGRWEAANVLGPMFARRWVEFGHPLGWPTADDLAYHLTTLFPPVRPKGWLELRMIDSLPDPWWRVPVAVAAALVDDVDAVGAARQAAGRWLEAARHGLGDEVLADAAQVGAERALAGLDRVGADPLTAFLVESWAAAVQKGSDLPWI